LAATMPGVDVWLMNTGFVGGDALDVKAGRALKVKIRHSSAMLEAMLAGSIKWKKDPDWNYEIVDVDAPENAALLEAVPAEILNPMRFYEAQGRQDEYRAWVDSMRQQRREFLDKFQVADAIVQAVVG
jgi:ATP-dependent phosphoenolpyruvate carboxykinase